MTDKEEMELAVKEAGYSDPKPLPDGRLAVLCEFIFTHAIIILRPQDLFLCYDDRYCYHSKEAAKAALDAWSGIGEPDGWHRHPQSSRRRNEKGEIYYAH